LREKKETERIAGYGQNANTNGDNGVLGNVEPDINRADEEEEGEVS